MYWFLRPVVLAVSLSFLVSNSLHAELVTSQKQRYADALSLQTSDPDQMIASLELLAGEGYVRATDRLAYFAFKGVGRAQNIDASIRLYEQAISSGRTSSLVSLGKVFLTIGAYRDAIEALEKASNLDHKKADAVLAWAHATGRLGQFSNLRKGQETLVRLAASDMRDAQMYLLDAAVRTRYVPARIDDILDRLHARQLEGDAKAAEALLRFYRARPHPHGTPATRKRLIMTKGVREKVRVEEGLYLARDLQPRHFWTASQELVKSAPPDVYARALAVTAKINKNAYVRILQDELRALGYSVGHKSPYMNAPLIKAVNRFCRDTGLNDVCKRGPLKSTTIKAVAGKLAEVRLAS